MTSNIRKLLAPDAEYSQQQSLPLVLTRDMINFVPLFFHPTNLFILKDPNQMRRSLLQSNLEIFAAAQVNYFERLSLDFEKKQTHVSAFYEARRDPVFVHFFADILQEYQITEFQIHDENGSFMLRDQIGNEYLLIIKFEEDLDLEEAVLKNRGLSTNLCRNLRERKLILARLKHDPIPQVEEVDRMMADPIIVNGNRRYYCTIGHRVTKHDFDQLRSGELTLSDLLKVRLSEGMKPEVV